MEEKNKELVSVIIPTYNRMGTLERSIQSVLNQTYTNFELLIIDDGSEDETEKYIRNLGDSRIRYYKNEHNVGPSASRNRGAALANGDFLAFQDSDDEWLPDKLQRLVEVLLSSDDKVGMVYHEMQEQFGERALIPSRNIPLRQKSEDILQYMLLYPLIGIPATLIKKSCFEHCGGFCEELKSLEDYEFFLRVAQEYRILFVEEALIYIYDTPGSVNKQYKNKIDTELYVLDSRYSLLCQHGLLTKKLELIHLQAENYECPDYFYEQLLQLCTKCERDKAVNILQSLRHMELEGQKGCKSDKASQYQNAEGQLEHIVQSLSKLQSNLRKNSYALHNNRNEIYHVLLEVIEELKEYADFTVNPVREKNHLAQYRDKLMMSPGVAAVIVEGLDSVLQEATQILYQIADSGCICMACNSKTRLLQLSPYRQTMRRHFGYSRSDVDFLFEEVQDRCPICGATQEIRFLLGFLEDVQPEGEEKLEIYCMTSDGVEVAGKADDGNSRQDAGFGWRNWIRDYAASKEYMEYIESKDQLRMDGNSEAKIDIIVCVDLLQQAEDASAVLAQIRQLLAPNGMCVMLVSALLAENAECGIEELSEQELALEDVGAIENAAVTWKRFGEEGIRRLYSEKELMESVEKAGFCISVADEEWFGADYYEQCGFGKKAKLYLLTVLAT